MNYKELSEKFRYLSNRAQQDLNIVPVMGTQISMYFNELAMTFDLLNIQQINRFIEGSLPAYSLIRQLTNRPFATFAINNKPSQEQKDELKDILYSFKVANAMRKLWGDEPIKLEFTHQNHEEPKVWEIRTYVNDWCTDIIQDAISLLEGFGLVGGKDLNLHVVIHHFKQVAAEHNVELIKYNDRHGAEVCRSYIAKRFEALAFPQFPGGVVDERENGRPFYMPLPDLLGGGVLQLTAKMSYRSYVDMYDKDCYAVELVGHNKNFEFLLWDHVGRLLLPANVDKFMAHVDALIDKPVIEETVNDEDTPDAQ